MTTPKGRNWRDVRAAAVDRGQITEEGIAKAGERREEFSRAYRLAEVRKSLGARQIDIASLIGVSQAMVSKLERGDIGHTEIGTLRSYIAALGGRLEVRADFGDEILTIQ